MNEKEPTYPYWESALRWFKEKEIQMSWDCLFLHYFCELEDFPCWPWED